MRGGRGGPRGGPRGGFRQGGPGGPGGLGKGTFSFFIQSVLILGKHVYKYTHLQYTD